MTPPNKQTLTRRAMLRLTGSAISLTGAAWLVACGAADTPAPSVATPPPAADASASSPPTAAQTSAPATQAPPVGAASAAPTTAPPSAAPSAPPPSIPASAQPSVAPAASASGAPGGAGMPPYKGIPQGRGADGFFFLGSATAPVTLIDYSDFL